MERRDQAIEDSLELLSARAGQLAGVPLTQLVDHMIAGRESSGSIGDDVAVLAARWLPLGARR